MRHALPVLSAPSCCECPARPPIGEPCGTPPLCVRNPRAYWSFLETIRPTPASAAARGSPRGRGATASSPPRRRSRRARRQPRRRGGTGPGSRSGSRGWRRRPRAPTPAGRSGRRSHRSCGSRPRGSPGAPARPRAGSRCRAGPAAAASAASPRSTPSAPAVCASRWAFSAEVTGVRSVPCAPNRSDRSPPSSTSMVSVPDGGAVASAGGHRSPRLRDRARRRPAPARAKRASTVRDLRVHRLRAGPPSRGTAGRRS